MTTIELFLLRNAFYTVEWLSFEHAEALALLNRLSPHPPEWARVAVRSAWDALEGARAVEERMLLAAEVRS